MLPVGSEFERRVSFQKAWDRRDPNPSKDYGISGVRVNFALIGPLGAVSFNVSSGWVLPHVREEWKRRAASFEPCAGPVCWHYPEKKEDWYAGPDECDLLPGGKCYGDAGYLLGNDAFDALCEGGEDGLWAFLEAQYNAGFKPEEVTA